jgi:hypothetical protein
MGRLRFTPEQIIDKLREAEVLLGQGTNIGEAIRKIRHAKKGVKGTQLKWE